MLLARAFFLQNKEVKQVLNDLPQLRSRGHVFSDSSRINKLYKSKMEAILGLKLVN